MHLGGKLEVNPRGPAEEPRRPLPRLHPRRRPRLPRHREEPRGRPPPDHQAQHRRRRHRRLRGPRPRQHRPVRRAAGDGGQGGAVQAVRRRRAPGRCASTPRTPRRSSAPSSCIAPVYGGINLEDIAAPRCFEIERRLRDELDIPVFHDDQHGTAIVVLAALTNALRVVGKRIEDVRVVISGVGAAGHAIITLLHAQGVGHIVACDRNGALHSGQEHQEPARRWIAENTNADGQAGTLAEVLAGADVFIGVSAPGLLTGEDVATMNADAIVFALANPDPEVDPLEAGRTRRGRGDRTLGLPEPDQQRAGLPRLLPRHARRRRSGDHPGGHARRRPRHRRRVCTTPSSTAATSCRRSSTRPWPRPSPTRSATPRPGRATPPRRPPRPSPTSTTPFPRTSRTAPWKE